MKEYPLTVGEAHTYLIGQIARGSSFGAGTQGELRGWRPMSRSLDDMRRDLCRFDAVGRMSKGDMMEMDRAIARLRAKGRIGPEWNGYLTFPSEDAQ